MTKSKKMLTLEWNQKYKCNNTTSHMLLDQAILKKLFVCCNPTDSLKTPRLKCFYCSSYENFFFSRSRFDLKTDQNSWQWQKGKTASTQPFICHQQLDDLNRHISASSKLSGYIFLGSFHGDIILIPKFDQKFGAHVPSARSTFTLKHHAACSE